MKFPPTISCLALALLTSSAAFAQTAARDREVAALFAPLFYQGIGDSQRSDYITNFDFDGDWRGDNNWDNVDNKRYALKAYVYYSVSETTTHYFIHYALFHARDYKGGTTKGRILSEILREGTNAASDYDPTGMAVVATVAHENDMEGCVVVVEKAGKDLSRARVVYVETQAHNKFLKYTSGSEKPSATIGVVDRRPLLYVEPKGHGVQNYLADQKTRSAESDAEERQSETMDLQNEDSDQKSKDKKSKKKDAKDSRNRIVVYRFAGRAEQPDKVKGDSCGYDLVPIQTTLWKQAQGEANETYGVTFDYSQITISVVSKAGSTIEHKSKIGMRGVAFLGKKGGQNIARSPWGWFDVSEKSQPLGSWFFDPAKAIKRHFKLDESFSTAYVRHPILGVGN